MMFRMLTVSLIVLSCGSGLAAQTGSTPADVLNKENPELNALVESHLAFIKEYYEPTEEQLQKIRETLTKLVPLEEAYHMRTDLTSTRIRTAMALLPAQATVSPADQQKIADKFQRQVNSIRSEAPLSYKNLVRFAEKALTDAQVQAGRSRLQKTFAKPAPGQPVKFEVDELDELVLGSIEAISLPGMPQPEPVSPANLTEVPEGLRTKPTPPEKRMDEPAAKPEVKQPEPVAKPAASQAPVAEQPKAPLQPAPPVEQWSTELSKIADKHGFDHHQRVIAAAILQTYEKRAATHRDQHSESYEEAEKITDAQQKAQTLRNLDEPLDKVYDELCRRIHSLSSIEKQPAKPAKDSGVQQ